MINVPTCVVGVERVGSCSPMLGVEGPPVGGWSVGVSGVLGLLGALGGSGVVMGVSTDGVPFASVPAVGWRCA